MDLHSQTLIFDADDTLWEDNAIFERVVRDFIGWVNHPTFDHVTIRRIFDEIEEANILRHGYGVRGFVASMVDAFAELHRRPAAEDDVQAMHLLAADLLDQKIELMPGVAETLTHLGAEHHLLMLTKGELDIQKRKVERSGLAHHFASVHIVPEKDSSVYRELVGTHALDPEATWMIGNSPKSDILPALDAGLRAVYIPSHTPWHLEHSELDLAHPRLTTIATFVELVPHFTRRPRR